MKGTIALDSITFDDLTGDLITANTISSGNVIADEIITANITAHIATITCVDAVKVNGAAFGDLTGASTNEAIRWSGTEYVPAPLANSGVSAGSYTLSNMTVNAQGLVTAASNGSLPNSGVSAGSYTNTNLTVNAQGIITAASNGSGASFPFAGQFIRYTNPTNNQTSANPYQWTLVSPNVGGFSAAGGFIQWENFGQPTIRMILVTFLLGGTSGVTDIFVLGYSTGSGGAQANLAYDTKSIATNVYKITATVIIPAGDSATVHIIYASGGAGFTLDPSAQSSFYFRADVVY